MLVEQKNMLKNAGLKFEAKIMEHGGFRNELPFNVVDTLTVRVKVGRSMVHHENLRTTMDFPQL